jgi:hypothetical protein
MSSAPGITPWRAFCFQMQLVQPAIFCTIAFREMFISAAVERRLLYSELMVGLALARCVIVPRRAGMGPNVDDGKHRLLLPPQSDLANDGNTGTLDAVNPTSSGEARRTVSHHV